MATLSAAHFVDSDITGTASGTGSWTSATPNQQDRTTAHPTDRVHLEAETVQVLQDGVVTANQTVSSGALTLTGSVNHAGLKYISTVKPSKIDLDGLGLVITKNITKAIVSFFNTLKGEVGTKPDKLETVSFGTTLFSGVKEVPVDGSYERQGDIIVRQDEPLPMICRGIILDLGGHDI